MEKYGEIIRLKNPMESNNNLARKTKFFEKKHTFIAFLIIFLLFSLSSFSFPTYSGNFFLRAPYELVEASHADISPVYLRLSSTFVRRACRSHFRTPRSLVAAAPHGPRTLAAVFLLHSCTLACLGSHTRRLLLQ